LFGANNNGCGLIVSGSSDQSSFLQQAAEDCGTFCEFSVSNIVGMALIFSLGLILLYKQS